MDEFCGQYFINSGIFSGALKALREDGINDMNLNCIFQKFQLYVTK